MIQTGFHRAALPCYTGFKSSPYTEGALFYGEKPFASGLRQDIRAQAERVEELKKVECTPGGA